MKILKRCKSCKGFLPPGSLLEVCAKCGVDFQTPLVLKGTKEAVTRQPKQSRKKQPEIKQSRYVLRTGRTQVVSILTHDCDIKICYPESKWFFWTLVFCSNLDIRRRLMLEEYEEHVRNNLDLVLALPELQGKIIGCVCKPHPCHGDVLIKLLKEFYNLE